MPNEYDVSSWDSYIGQHKLKETLQIHINGALDRAESLGHVLLTGPPGAGKTTLARLVAQEMFTEFESSMMPIKPMVMYRMVCEFQGVWLMDELHRLSSKQQEDLLPLIQDGYIQMDNGAKLYADNLTIIGATTEPLKIIQPLRDRFAIKPPFDPYTDREMGKIVQQMAEQVGVPFTTRQAKMLGRATGGVPRNAWGIVGMARDLDSTDTRLILEKCRLTEDGLTEMHVRYIQTLYDVGMVSGVDMISAHIQLPKPELVNLERLLLKRKIIEYSKQGRSLTKTGLQVLQKINKGNQ